MNMMTKIHKQAALAGSGEKTIGWAYLIILVGFTVLFLILTGSINFFLNPLVYSTTAKIEVAEAFASGKNYSVFNSNVDMRGLRREQIQRLPSNPDIVVIGGSRFQEALPDLFPDNSFLNAHVHSDYVEDMMAVTELLLQNGKLPKMMILSVRYQTFMPVDKRNSELWKNFTPEFNAMAERLGAQTYSFFDTVQVKRWMDLLSVPSAWKGIKQRMSAENKPGPTSELELQTLDILAADGSLRWSKDHLALFTQNYARQDALKHVPKKRSKKLQVNTEMVATMERLLAFLNKQGVKVVLVQTPFHPAFYNGVSDVAYGNGLIEIEAEAHRLAEAHGAVAVGSFDAAKVGCPASMFIDWHHANPTCLQKIFNMIPTKL